VHRVMGLPKALPFEDVHIPAECTHVKIDVGLSHNAPNSHLWLYLEPTVFVIGFEPNSEAIARILRTPHGLRHVEQVWRHDSQYSRMRHAPHSATVRHLTPVGSGKVLSVLALLFKMV
jgi:hypothetical protein